ncbi:MAG: hypothetical protein AAF297_10910 [Planctomycetota bacterium]
MAMLCVLGWASPAVGQVFIRGTVGGTRTIGPVWPGSYFVRVTDGRTRYVVPYRYGSWRWGFGAPIDGPYPPPTGPVDSRVTVGGATDAAGAAADAAAEAEDAEPPTLLERGWSELALGDGESALATFIERLNEEPRDAEAMRGMGFALLVEGDASLAAGCVRMAYEMSPELGMLVPGTDDFGGRAELRRLVVRAVRHGHEVESASAWLVAAVLAQAEGRADVVERFLGWAEAAGLEPETARWIRIGLEDAAED